MCRALLLTVLSPADVNAFIKGNVTAHQSFEAHGAGHLGRLNQRACIGQGQDSYRLHEMRAVDERQPFLRLQMQWHQLRTPQRFASCTAFTTVDSLTLSDK